MPWQCCGDECRGDVPPLSGLGWRYLLERDCAHQPMHGHHMADWRHQRVLLECHNRVPGSHFVAQQGNYRLRHLAVQLIKQARARLEQYAQGNRSVQPAVGAGQLLRGLAVGGVQMPAPTWWRRFCDSHLGVRRTSGRRWNNCRYSARVSPLATAYAAACSASGRPSALLASSRADCWSTCAVSEETRGSSQCPKLAFSRHCWAARTHFGWLSVHVRASRRQKWLDFIAVTYVIEDNQPFLRIAGIEWTEATTSVWSRIPSCDCNAANSAATTVGSPKSKLPGYFHRPDSGRRIPRPRWSYLCRLAVQDHSPRPRHRRLSTACASRPRTSHARLGIPVWAEGAPTGPMSTAAGNAHP